MILMKKETMEKSKSLSMLFVASYVYTLDYTTDDHEQ